MGQQHNTAYTTITTTTTSNTTTTTTPNPLPRPRSFSLERDEIGVYVEADLSDDWELFRVDIELRVLPPSARQRLRHSLMLHQYTQQEMLCDEETILQALGNDGAGGGIQNEQHVICEQLGEVVADTLQGTVTKCVDCPQTSVTDKTQHDVTNASELDGDVTSELSHSKAHKTGSDVIDASKVDNDITSELRHSEQDGAGLSRDTQSDDETRLQWHMSLEDLRDDVADTIAAPRHPDTTDVRTSGDVVDDVLKCHGHQSRHNKNSNHEASQELKSDLGSDFSLFYSDPHTQSEKPLGFFSSSSIYTRQRSHSFTETSTRRRRQRRRVSLKEEPGWIPNPLDSDYDDDSDIDDLNDSGVFSDSTGSPVMSPVQRRSFLLPDRKWRGLDRENRRRRKAGKDCTSRVNKDGFLLSPDCSSDGENRRGKAQGDCTSIEPRDSFLLPDQKKDGLGEENIQASSQEDCFSPADKDSFLLQDRNGSLDGENQRTSAQYCTSPDQKDSLLPQDQQSGFGEANRVEDCSNCSSAVPQQRPLIHRAVTRLTRRRRYNSEPSAGSTTDEAHFDTGVESPPPAESSPKASFTWRLVRAIWRRKSNINTNSDYSEANADAATINSKGYAANSSVKAAARHGKAAGKGDVNEADDEADEEGVDLDAELQWLTSENDEDVTSENDRLVTSENVEDVTSENDEFVTSENNEYVTSENDEFVTIEYNDDEQHHLQFPPHYAALERGPHGTQSARQTFSSTNSQSPTDFAAAATRTGTITTSLNRPIHKRVAELKGKSKTPLIPLSASAPTTSTTTSTTLSFYPTLNHRGLVLHPHNHSTAGLEEVNVSTGLDTDSNSGSEQGNSADMDLDLEWLCEPEWNNLELELFWSVLRPHLEQLLHEEEPGYLPRPCVGLTSCTDRADRAMLDSCLLHVQWHIWRGNYRQAVADFREVRRHFLCSAQSHLMERETDDDVESLRLVFQRKRPSRFRLWI